MDLRTAFSDMKGLTKDSLFRMRKFCLACEEMDNGLRIPSAANSEQRTVATARRQLGGKSVPAKKLAAAPPQFGERRGDRNLTVVGSTEVGPTTVRVLCKTADGARVHVTLNISASKNGVAIYQTALPDEKLIPQWLRQLPEP